MEHPTICKSQEHCSELEDQITVKPGSKPIGIEYLDYSNDKPRPETEISYVPDLMQGHLQPLEYIDDETLQHLDLEAIIAESQCQEQPNPNEGNSSPILTESQEVCDSVKVHQKSMPPPLLKLYKPTLAPAPTNQVNFASKPVIPPVKPILKPVFIKPASRFLPPVTDQEVDNNRFKR